MHQVRSTAKRVQSGAPSINREGELGLMNPSWEIPKPEGAAPTKPPSPTSVIPLRDFSWASAPAPQSTGSRYAVAVQELTECEENEHKGTRFPVRESKAKTKVRGELGRLMEPRGRALAHPAGPLLLEYAREGCPVDVGRPWTKVEIMTTAERGPHKSALA